MVEFTSGLWLYGTVGLFVVLLYMLWIRIRMFNTREGIFLFTAIIIGLLLFLFEQTNIYVILGLELGILTFNGLLNSHSPRMRTYYVSMSVLYLTLLHWVGLLLLAQAMLIGLLSSITNIKEIKSKNVNRKIEIERDVVHILAGIFFILLFYFESAPIAISVLMTVILGGILAISVGEIYKGKGLIPQLMYRFERNGTTLGRGALWLALGALLPVAFLSSHDVLLVFSAVFIGDPIATIVGVYIGGIKLPYNKSKSLSGTLAYFISTTAIASIFIGLSAIIIGAVGAIVESIKLKFDDNFTVSLVLVILILLLHI